MDRPDDEFENYLRQFQLRAPGPLSEQMQVKSRRTTVRFAGWAVAAVVLVAAVVTSVRFIRVSGTSPGVYATIENSGTPSLYKNGQRMKAGQIVRSNSSKGLMLRLEDGSRIEVRSDSVLAMESANDGAQIRLDSGSIIVEAAIQKSGHFYVKTPDALVSVVGTEFLVRTDPIGTRVAVFRGEVHVKHGSELNKLQQGEQIATSPSVPLRSIAEEISWASNASVYMAMLPQAPVMETPRQPTQSVARQNEAEASRPPLPSLPPLPQDAQTVVIPPAAPSSDLERVCGTCHSVSVAFSIAPSVDTIALQRKRLELDVELAQLRKKYTGDFPSVVSMESQIKQLEEQLASAKAAISTYVSKHYRTGGTISDQDLSAVIDALLKGAWSPVPHSPKKLK